MRRVARLLKEGSNPRKVLVCTFTRTAARDLQKELANLEAVGVERIQAGTLHSFCFGLLGREDVLSITGRVPRPLLQFEERFLLEDLRQPAFGNIYERRRRLEAFNAAWARLQSEDPGWPQNPTDREFHQALLAWLTFHKAMLIGELVPEALKYLRNSPASVHRRAFEHVVVDEYQDLNKAEQLLLDLLVESGNLIVVGDEDQSIYSFKYAHPEGIADFDQSHAETHDENLDGCRRCPSLVVEMANELIANNNPRTQRVLRIVPTNPRGEVKILQWDSVEEEAEGLAELIRTRVESQEVEKGKILVLSPSRKIGYMVRNALNNIGIFAHSFFHEEALDGDPKSIQDSSAQQTFTLLNLLVNQEDRVALRCWCGFGSSSLRSNEWNNLRQYCEANDQSPRAVLEMLARGDIRLPNCRHIFNRFRELQQRLNEIGELRGQTLVDTLFPTDQEWADPIRFLAATIEGEDFDAQALLESLRTSITQPELPTDVDYVRIMSLHRSKGLTADLVIVMGCIEGLIPRIQGYTDAEQDASLQEQRRLFYVAITRPRKILILSNATQLPLNLAFQMGVQIRRRSATHASVIASRFLNELGPSRPDPVLGTTVI